MADEPKEIILDDYGAVLDDDEETCLLTITGDDGVRTVVRIDREIAEEMAQDLMTVLGLDDGADDDED